MSFNVVALGWSIVAIWTSIRLFSSMNPLVSSEVGTVTSLVAALITKKLQSIITLLNQHLFWQITHPNILGCWVPCSGDNPCALREEKYCILVIMINLPCNKRDVFYTLKQISFYHTANNLHLSYKPGHTLFPVCRKVGHISYNWRYQMSENCKTSVLGRKDPMTRGLTLLLMYSIYNFFI